MNINEDITDYESAIGYIMISPSDLESITKINPKHETALIALNTLFTIAEAWNRADNFVADFSDKKQKSGFLGLNILMRVRSSFVRVRLRIRLRLRF